MKSLKMLSLLWLVITTIMLSAALPCQAQTNSDYFTVDSVRNDSTGAYWKLRTDYQTRSTSIRFFNAQHQLLYEEKLPGRYVKLTKRTTRLLNELLTGLTNRNLLDTHVDSYDLLASNQPQHRHTINRTGHDKPNEPTSNSLNGSSFSANSIVTDQGKMVVYCTNPDNTPIYVSLTDQDQKIDYYKERVKAIDYTRYFDVNQLPVGSYRLQIKHQKQIVSFALAVKAKGSQYDLTELKAQP